VAHQIERGFDSQAGAAAYQPWTSCLHPTGLIPRTLRPFNVFILLNGWICLHGVLD